MLGTLIRYISGSGRKDIVPVTAYDLWSHSYDSQYDNLMLALDEEIFSDLLRNVSLKGKSVIDIGCGTGRHWNKITVRQPSSLTGYDVSVGMLDKLRAKYPSAITYLLSDGKLPQQKNGSCDVLISTLTIAHIEELESALAEWNRILRNGGDVVLTDYHPALLDRGGKRTFHHNNATISIKNYVHSIGKIQEVCNKMSWEVVHLEERKIDDTMRDYYERKKALHVFNKFNGVPVIFGIHLKKKDVTA